MGVWTAISPYLGGVGRPPVRAGQAVPLGRGERTDPLEELPGAWVAADCPLLLQGWGASPCPFWSAYTTTPSLPGCSGTFSTPSSTRCPGAPAHQTSTAQVRGQAGLDTHPHIGKRWPSLPSSTRAGLQWHRKPSRVPRARPEPPIRSPTYPCRRAGGGVPAQQHRELLLVPADAECHSRRR